MCNIMVKTFMPATDNNILNIRYDGAVVNFKNTKIASTTDSYVVSPLFTGDRFRTAECKWDG